MSPEWKNPSASIASAVFFGRLLYPFMIVGPRRHTSPRWPSGTFFFVSGSMMATSMTSGAGRPHEVGRRR